MESNFELFYFQNIINEIFPIITSSKSQKEKFDNIVEKISVFNATISNEKIREKLSSLTNEKDYCNLLAYIYIAYKDRFNLFNEFLSYQSTILENDKGNVKNIIMQLQNSKDIIYKVGEAFFKVISKELPKEFIKDNTWDHPSFDDIKTVLDKYKNKDNVDLEKEDVSVLIDLEKEDEDVDTDEYEYIYEDEDENEEDNGGDEGDNGGDAEDNGDEEEDDDNEEDDDSNDEILSPST